MEKEFLKYMESLELKEIEFDEPCIAYFTIFGKFSNDYSAPRKYNSEFELGSYISAPTYSQAFSWLRKNYGYWCYIKEATKGTCRFYIEKFDEKFFNSDIIDSYEEAELKCLKKLIEIVKQKA
jgi:hypothetical protein